MPLYLNPTVFKLLYFLAGAVFAEEYRFFVIRPVIVSRFEKPIAPPLLAAKVARVVIFHLPERIFHTGFEYPSVHPKEYGCTDGICDNRNNDEIGGRVGTEFTRK